MTDLIAEPCPKHEGQRCPAPCHGAHRCIWDAMKHDQADAPQTALMLTQQEWLDLAWIADSYLWQTKWVDGPPDPGRFCNMNAFRRKRALAERIIEANQP